MKYPTLIYAAAFLVGVFGTTAFPQQQFVHTVTSQNKYCNSTCSLMDAPELANNSAAIVVVTPILVNGVNLNPHPVGVYFAEPKKWSVINVDNATIVEGAKFTIQYFAKPDASQFVFVVRERESVACIDRPGLNGNQNADVRFSPTGSPIGAYFNKHIATLEYDASVLRWCISNVNKEDLRANTAFNIVILPDPKAPSKVSTSTDQPPPRTLGTDVNDPAALPTGNKPAASRPPGSPCIDADADQKVGSWEKQQKDSLANADPTFTRDRYKPVLAKAQKIIDLLKRATPEPVGVEANAYRAISDRSYMPNGALPFGATAMYFGMHCMPVIPGDEDSGKVISSGETDTWIYFQVNSLGWLTNERMGLGSNFPTTNGRYIYYQPRVIGEIKGFQLLKSEVHPNLGEEAIVIAPDGSSPYKPVTREQFLQSLRSIHLKKIKTNPGSSASEEADIAKIDVVLSRMSPEERSLQAVILDPYAHPREMFVPESRRGSKSLATINTSFFNPALPRETIQMISVFWYWNAKDPAKDRVIRQFKQNFDFAALKQMLGT
jgi:hypothetical protein